MKKNIFRGNPQRVTCVIPCAGEGTRLQSDTEGICRIAKAMVPIRGKPIIWYVIDYWSQFVDDFIFIVKFHKEKIMEYIDSFPIKSSFVEQKELMGIAYALSLTEDMVSDNFIMVLGDCLCRGSFNFPADMETGVGVWATDREEDIKRSYSVEIENDRIIRVVEKPRTLVNNLCGMGFYFFNRKVFDYIRKTKPSKLRNEVEITDTLQEIINGGDILHPVRFNGEYLNVTYTEDIKRAEYLLRNEV